MKASLFSILFALAAMRAETPAVSVKTVQYGEKDIVPIKAKVRFTTLIVLPKQEQILDFTCGDKEFWIVNGNQNFAYVKPAKSGSRTNLNLVAASGNVYSFLLHEVSEGSDTEPDLKIYVEPRDQSMTSAIGGQPRFVPAEQIDDYRQQVEMAKAETRETRASAADALNRHISQFRQEYPTNLKFPYQFEARKKPFDVTAIYHDGKFTYINATPQEVPALYEIKDGKPNLIQFEFRRGTFVVDKVLDSGYLAIGRQKLAFTRAE